MEVLGVGTTGYAKDILKDVLKADVALVKPLPHTESALKFYEDPHCNRDVVARNKTHRSCTTGA